MVSRAAERSGQSALLESWDSVVTLFLLGLSLLVLLGTLVPTIYTLDSAEFVTGAATLGIVHAPGYPGYLLALNIFMRLPVGDYGFRGNLFSAVCLSLTVPIFYLLLCRLVRDRWIASITALIFVWSYHIWLIGLFAEVYAPQLLTLTICGLALAHRPWHIESRSLLVGVLFGVALAVDPASMMFAPGMVVAFIALRVPWQRCLGAAGLAVAVFAVSLLYFPWRMSDHLALNLAGQYDAMGTFQPVDLRSLDGILWMISGRQFGSLFFTEGVLTSPSQVLETASLFVRNFLGFGLILGLVGAWALWRRSRGLLCVWVAWFLPVTYFYTGYGAGDRQTMFAPSLLLWSVLIAFGLHWLASSMPGRWIRGSFAVLPALLLVVNFQQLNLRDEFGVRVRAETVLQSVEPNAVVFANWHDMVPLEYLRIIEHMRPDVRLYNLFLFSPDALRGFLGRLVEQDAPVIFVASQLWDNMLLPDEWKDQFAPFEVSSLVLPLPPSDSTPLILYVIRRRSWWLVIILLWIWRWIACS